jgi:hypothetical protein
MAVFPEISLSEELAQNGSLSNTSKAYMKTTGLSLFSIKNIEFDIKELCQVLSFKKDTNEKESTLVLNSIFTQSTNGETYCNVDTIDILGGYLHKDYKNSLAGYNKYVPSDAELNDLVEDFDSQEEKWERIQEYKDWLGIVGSFFCYNCK